MWTPWSWVHHLRCSIRMERVQSMLLKSVHLAVFFCQQAWTFELRTANEQTCAPRQRASLSEDRTCGNWSCIVSWIVLVCLRRSAAISFYVFPCACGIHFMLILLHVLCMCCVALFCSKSDCEFLLGQLRPAPGVCMLALHVMRKQVDMRVTATIHKRYFATWGTTRDMWSEISRWQSWNSQLAIFKWEIQEKCRRMSFHLWLFPTSEKHRVFFRELWLPWTWPIARLPSRDRPNNSGSMKNISLVSKHLEWTHWDVACGQPGAAATEAAIRQLLTDAAPGRVNTVGDWRPWGGLCLKPKQGHQQIQLQTRCRTSSRLQREMARISEQRDRLSGLTLEGPLEVAPCVYDTVSGMMQADSLKYLNPAKCIPRMQEITMTKPRKELRLGRNAR